MGIRAFFDPRRNSPLASAIDKIPDDIFPLPWHPVQWTPVSPRRGPLFSGHYCQQPRQIFFSARFKRASASFGSGRGGLTTEPVDAESLPALSAGGRSPGRGWRWPTGASGIANAGDCVEFEGDVPWAWA